MNARIRLIALAMGLALNTVALANVRLWLEPRSTIVEVPAAAPTDVVDGSLQDMEEIRNRLLEQYSTASEQTLEQLQDERRQFLAMADAYRQLFRELPENYWRFLAQMKMFEESCEAGDVEISGMPAQFVELLDTDKGRCSEEIAEMDAKARAYAQRIDEASAFQDQLDKAVAHVRGSSGSP